MAPPRCISRRFAWPASDRRKTSALCAAGRRHSVAPESDLRRSRLMSLGDMMPLSRTKALTQVLGAVGLKSAPLLG